VAGFAKVNFFRLHKGCWHECSPGALVINVQERKWPVTGRLREIRIRDITILVGQNAAKNFFDKPGMPHIVGKVLTRGFQRGQKFCNRIILWGVIACERLAWFWVGFFFTKSTISPLLHEVEGWNFKTIFLSYREIFVIIVIFLYHVVISIENGQEACW
jgi:hypothetical protein